MSKQRTIVLIGLAVLTLVFFSAAAYAFFGTRLANRDEHTIEPLPLGEVPEALRISVTEPGIVAISAAELDESYLPVDVLSPDSLFLTRNGEPVPFYVSGEGREAKLYFYAQVITDTMESPAVYWLGPGQGESMDRRQAAPSGPASEMGTITKRWEENEIFLAQASGDDVWLGKLLFAPSSLEVALDGIQPSGGPGELVVRIWSNNQARNEPDHHVEIALNGHPLADHFWDGIKQETITLEIPEGVLNEEENMLRITAPGDTGAAGEALYIDWIELKYESNLNVDEGFLTFESGDTNLMAAGVEGDTLVFDITEEDRPVALEEVEFSGSELLFTGNGEDSKYLILNPDGVVHTDITLVPQRKPLTAADRGADYIAIVAEAEGFGDTIQPLLDFRRSQGLVVEAIPAVQIFDEFGYGRATPESLRDFLRYAKEHWDPAPTFALLVGDASYDLHDYTDGKNKNLLPTYLIYSEFAGYVASDTWFTMSDEEKPVPAIALGRFPAQSTEQLKTMVEKTLAYEQSADSEWLERALLVADDEPAFDDASDDLAGDLIDVGYQIQKLYMTENENVHDAIVSALNQGVGIINYVGHGSVEVWGDERVFQAEDAEILINGDRLPIFTTFTCLNGYFNHPDVDALAETLIWAEDGGVVAAIAPSGRSLTSQQLPLAEVFFSRLLSGEAETLGEALRMAKLAGAGDEFLNDVIHTFNLLGDPALGFRVPSA
jgi:hypothetical protein